MSVDKWEVVFMRHKPTKVHKRYEDDGVLRKVNGFWVLFTMDGDMIGSRVDGSKVMKEDATIVVNGPTGSFECLLIGPYISDNPQFEDIATHVIQPSAPTAVPQRGKRSHDDSSTQEFASSNQPFNPPYIKPLIQVKKEPQDESNAEVSIQSDEQNNEGSSDKESEESVPKTDIESVAKSPIKKKIRQGLFDDDD